MNPYATLRALTRALANAAVLAGACAVASAACAADLPEDAPPGPKVVPIEQVGKDFVGPHRLGDVGGRKLNLYCRGALRAPGDVTVVFDSGLSDGINAWPLVQPAVATLTRACSYDRAGMGHSDPSPRPPTAANMVDDLHTLLHKAGIGGRVLLVGHSLGGFTAKLYARTYPREVAGLVLVDPAEENMGARAHDAMVKLFGADLVAGSDKEDATDLPEAAAHFKDCADKARAGALGADTPEYRRCSDPPRYQHGPELMAERRVIQTGANYQAAQAAEFAYSMYMPQPEADARYRQLFRGPHPLGDLPMVVLTATVYDLYGDYGYLGYRTWTFVHDQDAALSTRGVHRYVQGSRHNIQQERPQVIVDNVAEILAKARS
jgi:pimeloyl-ACP methyl ester carboxylesterase